MVKKTRNAIGQQDFSHFANIQRSILQRASYEGWDQQNGCQIAVVYNDFHTSDDRDRHLDVIFFQVEDNVLKVQCWRDVHQKKHKPNVYEHPPDDSKTLDEHYQDKDKSYWVPDGLKVVEQAESPSWLRSHDAKVIPLKYIEDDWDAVSAYSARRHWRSSRARHRTTFFRTTST
ncbi:hypothetical protein JCM10207_000185 [Rhodosporidiobolus poonsookiae]